MVIRYAPVAASRGYRTPSGALMAPQGRGLPLAALAGGVARLGAALKRRRRLMVVALALPLLAAAALQQLRPQVYQTSAAVFVDPQMARPGRSDAGMEPAVLAAQVRLATSRTVLKSAIDREKLVEDAAVQTRPSGAMALLSRLLALAGFERFAPSEDRAAAVMRLVSGSVAARAGEGANLIEVTARADEPQLARRLANAVAQSLVDELVASAESSLGSERQRLARRGEDLKARLADAEKKLAQYRVQSGLDAAQVRAAGPDGDLPAQLSRARQASAEARTRYEQLQRHVASGKEPEAIADLVRTPSLERLKVQYTEAAAQEISFRSSLGPRHPAYLEAAQQAREKRRLLQEGLRLAVSAARIDWQAAREQETAIERRAGPDAAPATVPQQTPMQLREFEREVELARSAYERFLRSVDQPDAASQLVAARIVSPAAAPLAASGEGGAQIWGAALAAGLALALLAGLSGLRPERRKPAASGPAKRSLRRSVEARAQQPSPEAPARPEPEAAPPPAPAPRDIAGLAAELAGRADEFPLQTVLVTGSAAGKSEASLALARAARDHQLRVLIIDADEERAELSEALRDAPLAGSVVLQNRPRPLLVVEPGGGHRICLIPIEGRGRPLASPSSGAMGGVAGNFDLVIIDGPSAAGSLSERKLARASQLVMVAQAADAPDDLAGVQRRLGVAASALRPVPAPPARIEAPAPTPARPMGVVRLRKVA